MDKPFKLIKAIFTIAKIWLILVMVCVFLASALAGAGYFGFQTWVAKPYNDFHQREIEIKPLLDDLNADIEKELPPLPSDSQLKRKTIYGLGDSTLNHGRWLRLEISTTLKPDDIFSYYRSGLLEKGWEEIGKYKTSRYASYYRGTSCIGFEIPDDKSFSIVIWHDYKKQTFTPVIPALFVTQFFEMDAGVSECP
jgi:hypothetical protein